MQRRFCFVFVAAAVTVTVTVVIAVVVVVVWLRSVFTIRCCCAVLFIGETPGTLGWCKVVIHGQKREGEEGGGKRRVYKNPFVWWNGVNNACTGDTFGDSCANEHWLVKGLWWRRTQ